jgi:hypothetical protein
MMKLGATNTTSELKTLVLLIALAQAAEPARCLEDAGFAKARVAAVAEVLLTEGRVYARRSLPRLRETARRHRVSPESLRRWVKAAERALKLGAALGLLEAGVRKGRGDHAEDAEG